MQTLVDAEHLAKGIAGGDLAAFERLVLAYQARLFNFALRLCGSPEDAEEIVQDAFVKAHRALTESLTPERLAEFALTPWLYKIVLNTVRNHHRRRRLTTVPLAEVAGRPFMATARAEGEPERQLLRADEQGIIERQLRQLPLSCRAAMLLRFVEELSYVEIAAALRQPIGTVKSHVCRGSRLLRGGLAAALADEQR